MARYRESGDAAFDPLSRAPKTTPGATDRASVQLVVELRSKLARAWLDAGAGTIGWHLHHHHKITLSRATINRILVRAGLATRDPSKRPITRAWRAAKDGRNPLLSPDSPALWTPRFSCR